MAKRFTDSEKWNDPWFNDLTLSNKLFWIYLCDNCNHAGIWKVNKKLAEYHMGNLNWTEVDQAFNGRVIKLNNEKWFIPKFIFFQYIELNPKNRAHQSVISILEKEGAYKGLTRSLQGRKVKEPLHKSLTLKTYTFKSILDKYPNKDGSKLAEKHFNASVRTDQDWQDINKALDNYLKSEKVAKGFIKNCSTWFNNWQDWIDIKPEPETEPIG